MSFAPGQSKLELSGTAPPDGVVCFALTGLSGENVSVAVRQGTNIIFSIDGLIDAQDRYSFTAARDRYRILVGQLMRSTDAERFRIRLSLSNTREGSNATPPVGPLAGVPGADRADDPPQPIGAGAVSFAISSASRPIGGAR